MAEHPCPSVEGQPGHGEWAVGSGVGASPRLGVAWPDPAQLGGAGSPPGGGRLAPAQHPCSPSGDPLLSNTFTEAIGGIVGPTGPPGPMGPMGECVSHPPLSYTPTLALWGCPGVGDPTRAELSPLSFQVPPAPRVPSGHPAPQDLM